MQSKINCLNCKCLAANNSKELFILTEHLKFLSVWKMWKVEISYWQIPLTLNPVCSNLWHFIWISSSWHINDSFRWLNRNGKFENLSGFAIFLLVEDYATGEMWIWKLFQKSLFMHTVVSGRKQLFRRASMAPNQLRHKDSGGIVAAPHQPAYTEPHTVMNTHSSIAPDSLPSCKDPSSGLGLCCKRTLVLFIAIFIIVLIIVFLCIFKVIEIIGPYFSDFN